MKKDFSQPIKTIFEKLGFNRMYEVREPQTQKIIKCDNPYYTNAAEGKVYRVFHRNKLKPLSEDRKRNKYCTVDIYPGNGHKRVRKMVHKIILDQYVPFDDTKTIGHHKNRNRHDNRLENLERVTSQQNAAEREKANGRT